MSDRLESNSLPAVADQIRAVIAESDAASLTSIEKALQAGRLLIAAKAECRHGEWLPFLEQAGLRPRKAQQYMQIASSNLKSATVALLGIRGALEFLAARELAVEAMQTIGDNVPSTDAPPAETLGAFARQLAGLERLVEHTSAMFDCFPPEERDRVSAQRVDSVDDVSEWGAQLIANMNAYFLSGKGDIFSRHDTAMAAIELLERDTSDGAAEIALRALMSLNREESASLDSVLVLASLPALERILCRAA